MANIDHSLPRVLCGEQRVPIGTHIRFLENNLHAIIARAKASPSRRNDFAKAIVCGRLQGCKSNELLFERPWYCQQSTVCNVCGYIRHHRRAELMVAETDFKAGHQLIHAVFRMPTPGSYAQSLEFAKLANQTRTTLRKAIAIWNRQHSTLSESIHSYAIGLHLAKRPTDVWLWPHVHLAMVAGRNVRIGGASLNNIETILTRAWKIAHIQLTDLDASFQAKGKLSSKSYSPDECRRRHRGKVVTPSQLANELAYACNINDENDTAEIQAQRDQLLHDLGSPTTFTRSRKRNSKSGKLSVPNQFDPVALGKNTVLSFPLGCNAAKSIEPRNWMLEKDDLIQQSLAHLRRHLKKSDEVHSNKE